MTTTLRTRAMHAAKYQKHIVVPAVDVKHLLDQLDQAHTAHTALRTLHRRFGIYEHEDACSNTSDEHREENHHEDSDDIGEYYCDQMPIGAVCDHCRDEDGERVDWPCATTQALAKGGDPQ